MRRRHRRRVVFAAVMGMLLLGECLSIEFGARLYLTVHSSHVAFKSHGYDNSSYYGDAFEVERRQAGRTDLLPDDMEYHEDFAGQYFNIVNGIRRTVGQPEQFERTVYLFGSSTTFDLMVPDQYTIASQLQKLLVKNGYRWRVINLGTDGDTVNRTLHRLKTITLQRGDVVIFYDGVMDAATILNTEYNRRGLEPIPNLCNSLMGRYGGLATVEILCAWVTDDMPTTLRDDNWLAVHAKNLADDYHQALNLARSYALANGASFTHVLQPQIYSRALTQNERESQSAPAGLERVYAATWPLLQDNATLNLTHVLDTVRDTMSVYVDSYHLNESGDAIIAAAIFNALTLV